MRTSQIDTATPDELAPTLLIALQRLGQLGREGAMALARQVEDDDADFDEAAEWIAETLPVVFESDQTTPLHLFPAVFESPASMPGFHFSGDPQ